MEGNGRLWRGRNGAACGSNSDVISAGGRARAAAAAAPTLQAAAAGECSECKGKQRKQQAASQQGLEFFLAQEDQRRGRKHSEEWRHGRGK